MTRSAMERPRERLMAARAALNEAFRHLRWLEGRFVRHYLPDSDQTFIPDELLDKLPAHHRDVIIALHACYDGLEIIDSLIKQILEEHYGGA